MKGRWGSPGIKPRTKRIPAESADGLGLKLELFAQFLPHALFGSGPADDDAGGGGDDQGRNLGDQGVSDGQDGVGLGGRVSRDRFCWRTPMMNPPPMLTKMIRIPAIASPRTNLLAPSMAP